MRLLGPARIKSLGYRRYSLEKDTTIVTSKDQIKERVMITFQDGQRYTRKEIKEKLGEIYSDLNLSKTLKQQI